MLASAPARRRNVYPAMKIRAFVRPWLTHTGCCLVLPLLGATAPQPAAAATAAADSDSPPLHEVVITATRIEADPFNIPAAISSVSAEQLRDDALGVNLSDDIATIPGLLARNRNNYAQDQQISIRGIGANSAFGIRGVRVYQDGIPATGPGWAGAGLAVQPGFRIPGRNSARSVLFAVWQLLGRSHSTLHRHGPRPSAASQRRGVWQFRQFPRECECARLRRSAGVQPGLLALPGRWLPGAQCREERVLQRQVRTTRSTIPTGWP